MSRPASTWYDETYYGQKPTPDGQEIKSNYVRNVGGYAPWMPNPPEYVAWVLDELKNRYPKRKKFRVLELGCAFGFITAEFRRQGHTAFGLDFSEYAISQADESVRPYLSVLDVYELSPVTVPALFVESHEGKYAFDVVVSRDMMMHIEEYRVLDVFMRISNLSPLQIHQICTGENEYDGLYGDPGHVTRQPMSWWQEKAAKAGGDIVLRAT